MMKAFQTGSFGVYLLTIGVMRTQPPAAHLSLTQLLHVRHNFSHRKSRATASSYSKSLTMSTPRNEAYSFPYPKLKTPHSIRLFILKRIVYYEGFWEIVRFNGTVEGNEYEIALKFRS